MIPASKYKATVVTDRGTHEFEYELHTDAAYLALETIARRLGSQAAGHEPVQSITIVKEA